MMDPEAEIAALKARYGMQPIPGEGAFFAEGPRLPGLSGAMVLLTAEPGGASSRHRLSCDEGWQWLDGSPCRLIIDDVPLTLSEKAPQAIVPGGSWQSADTLGSWTLIACWCSPSFDQSTFEM